MQNSFFAKKLKIKKSRCSFTPEITIELKQNRTKRSTKEEQKNVGSHVFMARYCGALQNLFWSLNKGRPSLRLRCSLWTSPCVFSVVWTTCLLLHPFQNRGKEKFRRSLPYNAFHFFLIFSLKDKYRPGNLCCIFGGKMFFFPVQFLCPFPICVWAKDQMSILHSPMPILCTEVIFKDGVSCIHTYIVALEQMILALIWFRACWKNQMKWTW